MSSIVTAVTASVPVRVWDGLGKVRIVLFPLVTAYAGTPALKRVILGRRYRQWPGTQSPRDDRPTLIMRPG